ncbi:hypothetical protein Tco_0097172 [Tanacetum coccineum]
MGNLTSRPIPGSTRKGLDCQEKSYLTTESGSETTRSKTGAKSSISSKGSGSRFDTAYPRDWIRRIGGFLGVETTHGYAVSSLMDTAYWSSE